MRPVYALAAGLLALGGAATADEKAPADLDGTYLLVGLENKGKKYTADDFKKVPDADRKIVIKGEKITSYLGGKEEPAVFKADAGHKPAHFDVTVTRDGKTEVNYGIYKLESGVLTICTLEKGEAKDRPKEFKAGDKVYMFTLQKHNAK